MTEIEVSLEILDEPAQVEFFAVAGAKGDKGDAGSPGQDGHSPVVTASKSGKVTTVFVDNIVIAAINDGDDGADGDDGQDGYSPAASVSKVRDTATITITDKNGTTTATISDGAPGQDGADPQYLVRELSPPSWAQGSIDATTGANGDAVANRCRSGYFMLDSAIRVDFAIKPGYRISFREYERNSSSTFIGNPSPGWKSEPCVLYPTPGHWYRIMLAKTDNADIPVSGIDADAVTFTEYLLFTSATADLQCKLQQLNRRTRISGTTFGSKPLCLLHFSDIHADSACLARILAFADKYHMYIDDVLHTGDTVAEKYSEGITAWDRVAGSGAILNCVGNHDSLGDSVPYIWNEVSMADCYTRYFAPYISGWGLTSYESGKTYYYKDYTTEGVRLIVLDIMHQTAEQLAWFTAALASARTTGLHVLVAVHSRAWYQLTPYQSAWDDYPIVSYGMSEDTSGTTYPKNLSDSYPSAVDDFIDAGGCFVAWIHGHTHYKILAKVTGHARQLDIGVANAGFANANTYVWERVANTKSADDFSVLAVDTTSKILRIVKVGVDYDIYLRHTDTLSYDYGTSTLIQG